MNDNCAMNKATITFVAAIALTISAHALSPARVEERLQVEFAAHGIALEASQRALVIQAAEKAMRWCRRETTVVMAYSAASEGSQSYRMQLASARAKYLIELLKFSGIPASAIATYAVAGDQMASSVSSDRHVAEDPSIDHTADLRFVGVPEIKSCP